MPELEGNYTQFRLLLHRLHHQDGFLWSCHYTQASGAHRWDRRLMSGMLVVPPGQRADSDAAECARLALAEWERVRGS